MLATASGSQANRVKFKFVVIGGGIAGVTCVEMVSFLTMYCIHGYMYLYPYDNHNIVKN